MRRFTPTDVSPRPNDRSVTGSPRRDPHGRRVDRPTGHHAITARGLHSQRLAMRGDDGGESQ